MLKRIQDNHVLKRIKQYGERNHATVSTNGAQKITVRRRYGQLSTVTNPSNELLPDSPPACYLKGMHSMRTPKTAPPKMTLSNSAPSSPEPKSQPAPPAEDPLRMSLNAIRSDETRAHARLAEWISKRLGDINASDLQTIARFVDIVEHDHGCNTPSEEFIAGLVDHHYIRHLTPEAVIQRMPEFIANMRAAVSIRKRFHDMNQGRQDFPNPLPEPESSEHETAICDAIEFEKNDRAILSALIASVRRCRGSITPAEEFITDILRDYSRDGRLTPEDAASRLQEFQQHYEECMDVFRDFGKRYSDRASD